MKAAMQESADREALEKRQQQEEEETKEQVKEMTDQVKIT